MNAPMNHPMDSPMPNPILNDEGAILQFWERAEATGQPHNPAETLEGWVELIQIAATDMLRRDDEAVPRLARANGFSSREATRAFRGALGGLTRHALLGLWEEQDLHRFGFGALRAGGPNLWPERTVIFAGGAIPQPGLQSLVGALMISGRVLIRPSRLDPFLIPEFVETLARVQAAGAGSSAGVAQIPSLRESVACASWDRANPELTRRIVGAADSMVIYGEAKTVAELSAFRRPDADGFIYGPRISFAVLDATSTLEDSILELAMNDFADDVAAFDQRGCLSPQVLYVLGPGDENASRILGALARSLDRSAENGGFTPNLPASAAGAIQSLRATYAMDPEKKRRVIGTDALPGWTILVDEANPELRPLPGYQTIRIVPLPSWEALIPVLITWTGQLQCMGIGPDTACIPESINDELENLGLSRACPLGRMQAPPLQWTHDGNPFFPVRVPAE